MKPKTRNRLTVGVLATILAASWAAKSTLAGGYVPRTGFVPDANTAAKVAEAVLVPVYGARVVDSETPLRARLQGNNIWIVEGTLPKNMMGGVAVVRIDRTSGRILSMNHGK